MEIPTEYISNVEDESSEKDDGVEDSIAEKDEIEVVYENLTVRRIYDKHTQENDYDVIILRDLFGYSLKQLAENGFNKLQWDISIGIKEIDHGYQELYLGESIYADKDNRKTEPIWSEEKFEFNNGEKGSYTYNVRTFVLDILDCSDVLYFTYSANGYHADTWERTSLIIKIKAYK